MLGALTLVAIVCATLACLVVIVLVIDGDREIDNGFPHPEWTR